MEAIFHEKQEGSLCAQHCLNALLQGSYFTAVDLAELARQLDDDERSHMAEAGLQSDDYQRFLEQPSTNFDDSGFFSIQVILKAVKVWGLDLIPFSSQDAIAVQARKDPRTQQAYICNFREHWFSIRHLGNQWFNLNSLLTGPELISNTYLSMFLTQLQQECYSIFIVLGKLPESEADQLLKLMPAVQTVRPGILKQPGTDGGVGGGELQQALQASRQLADTEDAALQKVLSMSMQGFENAELPYLPQINGIPSTSSNAVPQPSSLVGATPWPSAVPEDKAPPPEEVRQRRQAFIDRVERKAEPEPPAEYLLEAGIQPDTANASRENSDTQEKEPQRKPCKPSEMTEEQMIQEAIKLSMQSS